MLRKVSKKKARSLYQQRKMYASLERTGFCSGCGRSDAILTNSHLLSQGQYKQYQNEAWNLVEHCRQCNSDWQNHLKRPLFLDYARNMEIIKLHDERAYFELIGKESLKKQKYLGVA
ncbi:hypothetical protein AHMF7605_11975 [Adhaeribacter arboris]|uniref:Uncharacterized protein n=1 Tax=Adhaeribacter arboris TaxID=2072846 RepID=A0A2T2YF97_9BACT|nr:hypothetical protein [Adhaeribacter arboris]PSR54189.1 hypothetical protein AHMF7605_11975 [Adhaeribacter arboris]